MKIKAGILILLVVLIFSCTQKNNPVGYEPVDQPRYLELRDDIISNLYSYEDSVKYYQNASEISLGNQKKYESRILMRFLTLPDSLAEIENDEIIMKLCVHKQKGIFTSNIAIGKLNQYWNQNYITWKAAADTIDWEEPYFELTEYEISDFGDEFSAGDTIEVTLPLNLFYYEENDKLYADSLASDYGLILMQTTCDYESETILEFYSNEAAEDYQPELRFSYKADTSDEEYTDWTSATVYDGMLYESNEDDLETYDVYADSLIFRNISPTKMFIGLDIGLEDFIMAGDTTGIDDYDELNRITVNKANLVLHAKDNKYLSSSYLYMIPYLMTDSVFIETPLTDNIPVYDEQYEYVSSTSATSDTLTSNEYRLDITEIIQAYLIEGDDISGYGLIIFSSRENRDFSRVRFFNHKEDEANKPYIELYYTPPLLP